MISLQNKLFSINVLHLFCFLAEICNYKIGVIFKLILGKGKNNLFNAPKKPDKRIEGTKNTQSLSLL